MKKRSMKTAVKIVAFIAAFSVVFSYVSFVFQPKAQDPTAEIKAMQQYYALPKNKIEFLFLGNSQISCGADAVRMYNRNGIFAYTFGGGSNPLLVNYYFLLEAIERHNIKAVTIDVSAVYNEDDPFDAAYRKNLDGMRLSKYKLAAVRDYINFIKTPETEEYKPYQIYLSYLFNLLNYHPRWNELDEVDFDREMLDGEHFNGYYATEKCWEPDVSYKKFLINTKQKLHKKYIREEQADYLIKILDTCKANHIEVLLIKTPKKSWEQPGHDYVQQLADEQGVPFMDFNTYENLKAIGYVYKQDMRDKDHLNARGAIKLTDYIADYFAQRVEFTDYRDSGVLDAEFLASYERAIKRCYLNSSHSPERYLTELKGKDYTITFQSDGDLSAEAFSAVQDELTELGLTVKLSDLKNRNYIAVLNNGKPEYEEASSDDLKYKLSILSKNDVSLKCTQDGNTTWVFDTKYNFAQGGLRICVFENATGEFISRVSIYEENGKLLLKQKKIYEIGEV